MHIIRATKIWLGISGVLVLAALVCIFTFRYHLGIDFAGGTALEISTGTSDTYTLPEGESLNQYLISTYKDATGQTAVAQNAGSSERWILRSQSITNEQKNSWLEKAKTAVPNLTELQFTSVSPTIGAEVVRKAILAVILAVLAILLYLAYTFRRVPKPSNSWRFGVTAIAALAHDTIILLGVYAVLSRYFGAEIDGMFITALLTLLGFSVHDTIVTFDRLRENLIKRGGNNFEQTVNDSIVESITRSINTSFTLMLVLAAMTLMGGRTTFFFTLSLLIGIIVGTYSSIFVASPLLLMWQKSAEKQQANEN